MDDYYNEMTRDFMDLFGNITSGEKSSNNWTDVDELNSLWEAYDSFVQDLKADGYKIYRNENGKHKIVKV